MGGGRPGFSIRVSPPSYLAQVTRGPNIWQKTTLKGALLSQGHGQWHSLGVASPISPPQAADVKPVSKSHESKMSSEK